MRGVEGHLQEPDLHLLHQLRKGDDSVAELTCGREGVQRWTPAFVLLAAGAVLKHPTTYRWCSLDFPPLRKSKPIWLKRIRENSRLKIPMEWWTILGKWSRYISCETLVCQCAPANKHLRHSYKSKSKKYFRELVFTIHTALR